MSISHNDLQTMLKSARDNWNWDCSEWSDPQLCRQMNAQIKGMIGADLNEDGALWADMIAHDNDFDGLDDYIRASIGRY